MKQIKRLALLGITLLLVFCVIGCGGQNAQEQPSDTSKSGEQDAAAAWPEKGTTIEFSVEYSAGGGYDTYTRALAPYIEKYLPGTKVVVVNKPGADGALAANYLYNSKPDGTKLQIISVPGLVVRQLFQDTNYDLKKLTWLGQVASGYYVTAVRTESPYKTIDDLLKAGKQITIGTAGVADTSAITSIIAYSTLGLNFKIVPHQGLQEATVAALRGDVDVVHGPYSTILPLIKDGKLRVLLTYTKERLPSIPDTPTAAEIGYPQLTGQIELKRPIATSPGLDPEKTEILREAIWKAMNDPEFKKWGEETEHEIVPLSGQETEEAIQNLFNIFEEKEDLLKQYLKF